MVELTVPLRTKRIATMSQPTVHSAAANTTELMPVPLLDVHRENAALKVEFAEAFAGVVESSRFVLGPECEQMEQQIAERVGTQFAIGCASGSDSLLLALMAIGLKSGDEVIVPSFTFFATASAVHRLGGKPVFADICPKTYNIDTDHVRELVTGRTRAIIPVHLFGQCAQMERLSQIADESDVQIIEDCAQSLDATYRGLAAGSMSAMGCFSFYPTKNLGGCGDGGMITTSDAELAERLRMLRVHGMKPRYLHQFVGINSRLDTIQAALLLVKLRHLQRWNELRCNHARRYQQLFEDANLTDQIGLPDIGVDCSPVWNQYTIRVRDGHRDALRAHLMNHRIGCEIYYPIPLHRQPCFEYLDYSSGSLPVTEQAAAEVLSLPIFPLLTTQEQTTVVDCIGKFFS